MPNLRKMKMSEKTMERMKAAMQRPGTTAGKAYRKAKSMSEQKPSKKLPEKRVMRRKGGKAKRMCK